ncbi:MAG: hypothetical protein DRO11_10220, partial [Methanobacteriota archaeon]
FDDAEVIYSDPSTSPPWDVSSLKDSDNPIFSGNNSGVCDVDIGKYNGYYYMVYSEWEEDTTYRNIYLARSTDLKNWTILNNGNPIISHGNSGDWDSKRATYMSFLKDINDNIITYDSKFWIFYTGVADAYGQIGRAYRDASGGLEGAFTKDDANNPLPPFNNTNNHYHNPVLFKYGTTFYMYYAYSEGESNDYEINLATSADLLNWSDSANNPLLSPTGSDWESQRLIPEDIYIKNYYYYLLYTGYDGTHYRAGLARATSIDTTAWEKESNNPIIDVGNTWDDRLVDHGSLVVFNDKYYIIYTGVHGTGAGETSKVGLSYLTNPFKWTKVYGTAGELKRSADARFTGNYGLKWIQSGDTATLYERSSIFPSSGKFIVEMRWKPLTSSNAPYMYCLHGRNAGGDVTPFILYNRYGKLTIWSGDYYTLLNSLTVKWYHLRLDIDQDNHKILAAYVDGEEKLGTSIDFGHDVDLEKWQIGGSVDPSADHYLDNLLIRKYASPEPSVSIGSENVRITFSSYPEGASIEVIK